MGIYANGLYTSVLGSFEYANFRCSLGVWVASIFRPQEFIYSVAIDTNPFPSKMSQREGWSIR